MPPDTKASTRHILPYELRAMRLRTMTEADVPAGMRLKDLSGWNQTEHDWQRFLSASPHGCFVAEMDGQVVGTVATISYENKFAWIGMVLVDPARRGRELERNCCSARLSIWTQRRYLRSSSTPRPSESPFMKRWASRPN